MSLKPKRVDFVVTWKDLRDTIAGVITLSNVPRAVWNDRFSDVYSLCVAQPESLADRLYQETKLFFEEHVNDLLDSIRNKGDMELLKSYCEIWNQFSKGIDYVHKLYLYLNTQHIKKHKLSEAEMAYGNYNAEQQEQMKEIGELGLELWQQIVIGSLRSQLVAQILAAIQADRQGDSSKQNPSAVQGTILSLVAVQDYKKKASLQLYEEVFEKPFLEASGAYYRQESSRLFQDCTVPQYMERVIQKLEEEQLRARKFLHASSFSKVSSEFQQRLVGERLDQLHLECKPLVIQESSNDLHNLYTLLRPLPGALQPLIQEVQSHIQNVGLNAIENLKGDGVHMQFVENILNVYHKYQSIIRDVFGGDQQFMSALDKACIAVINHRTNSKQPCRSSELLAKYCDSMLKKSSKGLSENEMEDKLSQSVTVFKYIDDKDVFQKFYARMLAKRLIYQCSHSMDAEEAMINRLKQACGYEFTNKLHRMFTDITVSGDLNEKFSDYLIKETYDLGINFSIYVLQAGAWPLNQSNPSPLSVPQQLEKSMQMFENFYHNHFNGRKLTWLQHMSNGELNVCLSKKYIVTMQTYQMALLLLFESANSLTVKELQDSSQLSGDVFTKQLSSLVESKLLVAEDMEYPPDSVVRLNLEYTNKRTRFRITAAMQKESVQEVEQTHSSVDEDRKLFLQAAIVRIMKARKLIKHTALIQEVLSQTRARFAPSVPMIKKCIETLIDKQYLERTPNTTDEYSYVA